MKIRLAFLFALCILSDVPLFAVELSTTNEGVYIGIGIGSALCGDYPFPADRQLVWRSFSASGGSMELNYPDPEYFLKIDMHDLDGKRIPKTSEGRKIGSKFDKVKSYSDVNGSWHMGIIDADGKYGLQDGPLISGPVLPEPSKWFKMDKPGIYEMEIQFQMFQVFKKTNGWSRHLIRFEPMKVKVRR